MQEYDQQGREGQLFPFVPALNPYNLCNPDAENGVDCGLAQDAYFTNPSIVQNFANYYLDLANCFGVPAAFCSPATFGLLSGPIGAVQTRPRGLSTRRQKQRLYRNGANASRLWRLS